MTELCEMIPIMRHIRNIHFVGIGGVGMGGIAAILANKGYQVSGSDLVSNIITQQLASLGVKIYFGHRSEYVHNANAVVVSSAISSDNPEIVFAKKKRIPIVHRAEMLSELMRFYKSIIVAGTHGKTTTTAMIASIYLKAGLDPTFINGGLLKTVNIYANLGYSRYFISEADESDASLLYLKPIVAVITNIESDHMDTYHGNFENLKQTFINFVHSLPFYSYAIMCIDDPTIRELLPLIRRQVITYGFRKDADIQIENYEQINTKSHFFLSRKNREVLKVTVNAPGRHNALNAAAAITVAAEEGINDKIILHALKHFQGVKRRFDFLGEISLKLENGTVGTAILIDDYGHHPTEIDFTIKTARAGWPDKNLIMLFQPHRFTRTRDLYNDFANVLSKVDSLLMLEVYSAGETPISGVDSQSLCRTICESSEIVPILISNHSEILKILKLIITGNDLIIFQGAGNIGNFAYNLANLKLS